MWLLNMVMLSSDKSFNNYSKFVFQKHPISSALKDQLDKSLKEAQSEQESLSNENELKLYNTSKLQGPKMGAFRYLMNPIGSSSSGEAKFWELRPFSSKKSKFLSFGWFTRTLMTSSELTASIRTRLETRSRAAALFEIIVHIGQVISWLMTIIKLRQMISWRSFFHKNKWTKTYK